MKYEKEWGNYYDDSGEDFRVSGGKEIIKSYRKETFKDTAAIIKINRQFFNLLSAIREIYIYGHSLSEIDFEYFLEIKKCTSSTYS